MFICQIFCRSEHTANEQTEQAEHGEALHEHILRALVSVHVFWGPGVWQTVVLTGFVWLHTQLR